MTIYFADTFNGRYSEVMESLETENTRNSMTEYNNTVSTKQVN
jgi:hypothetical protein